MLVLGRRNDTLHPITVGLRRGRRACAPPRLLAKQIRMETEHKRGRIFSVKTISDGHAASWAEARVKIARVTLTIKLDGNWSSFQLAICASPLSVTDSAIAPSARMALTPPSVRNSMFKPKLSVACAHASEALLLQTPQKRSAPF